MKIAMVVPVKKENNNNNKLKNRKWQMVIRKISTISAFADK
jgi:hypothetical protein